jgi:hypothetical protein
MRIMTMMTDWLARHVLPSAATDPPPADHEAIEAGREAIERAHHVTDAWLSIVDREVEIERLRMQRGRLP